MPLWEQHKLDDSEDNWKLSIHCSSSPKKKLRDISMDNYYLHGWGEMEPSESYGDESCTENNWGEYGVRNKSLLIGECDYCRRRVNK